MRLEVTPQLGTTLQSGLGDILEFVWKLARLIAKQISIC
jgi:hypothetical protein